MKDSTAKLIMISGLASMGILTDSVIAIPVVAVASGVMLLMKDKTPHSQLKDEIKSSFLYKDDEAETYAAKLERMAMKEYNKAFDECTVTKED